MRQDRQAGLSGQARGAANRIHFDTGEGRIGHRYGINTGQLKFAGRSNQRFHLTGSGRIEFDSDREFVLRQTVNQPRVGRNLGKDRWPDRCLRMGFRRLDTDQGLAQGMNVVRCCAATATNEAGAAGDKLGCCLSEIVRR